ncbi:unnamed protein product [Vitrella brassicaformis CCMP3155]|uniref:Uncharacterized protein n=3 Tax=Vitrella brassicaformis TaxID=1169539 RepID=A0A0G4ERV8_VITBC|nr:unnamed protein product [Vitrella brassicaformis CCMP3155]|eukprot:CEM00600.1 unnamed protein product [Vitrella brassicaformis CCMP3155]
MQPHGDRCVLLLVVCSCPATLIHTAAQPGAGHRVRGRVSPERPSNYARYAEDEPNPEFKYKEKDWYFFYVSDLHIVPRYDGDYITQNTCSPDLTDLEKDRLTGNEKNPWTKPAYWGRIGCDPPIEMYYSLVAKTKHISKIRGKKSTFTIMTGDVAGHGMDEYEFKDTRRYRAVALMHKTLRDEIESEQFIWAPGNNDLWYNYYIDTETPAMTLAELRESMEGHAPTGSQPDLEDMCAGDPTISREEDLKALATSETLMRKMGWQAVLWEIFKDDIKPFAADGEDQSETFLSGVFYSVEVPPPVNVRVLALNSIIWLQGHVRKDGHNFPWNQPGRSPEDFPDPLGQLAWMRRQLTRAKEKAQKVYVILHAFPGFHSFHYKKEELFEIQFHELYFRSFQEIMYLYRDTILAVFAGHIHGDSFRVPYFNTTGYESADVSGSSPVPSSSFSEKSMRDWPQRVPLPKEFHQELEALPPIYVAAAMAPIYGNNPAFKAIEFEPDHKYVADMVSYFLPLAQTNNYEGRPRTEEAALTADDWFFYYRFTDAYGLEGMDQPSLTRLLTRIADPRTKERALYSSYYYASGNMSPHMECIMTSLASYKHGGCLLDTVIWQQGKQRQRRQQQEGEGEGEGEGEEGQPSLDIVFA